MEKFKLNLPTYGAIAGGVLIVYGVSKTGALRCLSWPERCLPCELTRG